ncbi:enoyl-CoA hydratase/isomerase family protein [Paraburkholderia guartelaensis]|uniref:Enoyl-CoA hydratase/isomerase family protein n=1 Tax=Paraburkholderia guartelaensis TaxID=2546446 RepID=A0A4R5LGK4_9BURK|nr:enoyl-CoA hydratase/isomerase family protein [Paraburkholderia guartelaensis]TDG08338.1 enoyl-CoA hydratase/isomerase family protein [Paraburkholderia guartelaensis]
MSTIVVSKLPTHWTITLNRPDKLNALCASLVEELIQAFDEAQAAGTPLVVLQGEGRCFSAGFDMSDVQSQSEGDLLLRFVRIEVLLNKIASSPCFTVALAHGRNFGAGVDLIAACNLRAAAPGSTFRMPGLKFGLALGSARFARIVGTREAQRILEMAATFDVERAIANGFIERVVGPEQHAGLIAEALERVNALPAESRALLRRALDTEQADTDLAALVRSACAPGIHTRIEAYLTASKKAQEKIV